MDNGILSYLCIQVSESGTTSDDTWCEIPDARYSLLDYGNAYGRMEGLANANPMGNYFRLVSMFGYVVAKIGEGKP